MIKHSKYWKNKTDVKKTQINADGIYLFVWYQNITTLKSPIAVAGEITLKCRSIVSTAL